MSKQSLLLVDGDTRSLRVLEVSLRKAGFSVTPAVSVGDALDKLEANAPDLIISETKFTGDLDGFELRRRLRSLPAWSEIPFIFLTAETAIENKIKGLELGVDDYLTKPIYIKEIVTRINILLQKRQRQFLDLKKDGTRFAGRVADMPVVDVIQTIEVSRKSGVIQFTGPGQRQATIYFRDGKVIDAEAGTLQAEDAVYRLLTWSDGEFEVEFRTVRRRDVITMSSQGLLMEGMRRLDEWSRLLEQLPPLTHRFEIDAAELSGRLGEVPDDNNRILRLFDTRRTLLEVIDASDFGDLECLQAISRLYFEGLLIDLDPGQRTKRETGKPGPLVAVNETPAHTLTPPTPIEQAASGPIRLGSLQTHASGGASEAAEDEINPPLKGTLTMGWDAQPDPTEEPAALATPPQAPRSLTMGWDAQPDPTESTSAPEPTSSIEIDAASNVLDAEPEATPRARRESSVQISDLDVVGEEELHGPLSGGYRPSSLRLIDEAVAAAQLIEPSLFTAEELAAAGVAPPPSAVQQSDVTDTATARSEPMPAAAEPPPVAAPDDEPREALSSSGVSPRPPTTPPPFNGSRERKKTVPPPVPRAPAKMAPRAVNVQELDDAPLLDSSLLLSGEHRIPSERELNEETPLLETDLLMVSGEHKIPTEAEIFNADSRRQIIHVPPPAIAADEGDTSDDDGPAEIEHEVTVQRASDDDSGGVPREIEGDDDQADDERDGGPTNLELPARRTSQPHRADDSQSIRMIGSYGKDRAEASGELKPPSTPRGSEPGLTQRELVTIMPRRKTGEVPQLRPEDLANAAAAVPPADAASRMAAAWGESDAKPAPATKPDTKPAAQVDAKVDAKSAAQVDATSAGSKPATPEAKSGTKPAAQVDGKPRSEPRAAAQVGGKPAVEPPSAPARHVSVEGGVVAPRAGMGRLAQLMLVFSVALAGFTAYSYCGPEKRSQVATTPQHEDASTAPITADATEYAVLDIDAKIAVAPTPDASVAVVVAPDAAVPVVPFVVDAGVAVATNVDAGIDKNKEAKLLFDKGRLALEEGDATAALALFDQSLKVRRQPRAYLERARALQRLQRIDDAVASVDDALKMNDNFAPAHEQKGMILWSAQRYSEARPALERYLELAPDGAKAATIRSMLDEPR